MDSVPEEEIDFSDDAGNIDAREVANAAAVVGGGLEVGELVLRDFAPADGIVVVSVA